MGKGSRVDVENGFGLGGGELDVAVLFCWVFCFLDSLPGTEPTSVHVLVRCSVTGRQHWDGKKDCFFWQAWRRQQDKEQPRKSGLGSPGHRPDSAE